jgi:hypothetical protein
MKQREDLIKQKEDELVSKEREFNLKIDYYSNLEKSLFQKEKELQEKEQKLKYFELHLNSLICQQKNLDMEGPLDYDFYGLSKINDTKNTKVKNKLILRKTKKKKIQIQEIQTAY